MGFSDAPNAEKNWERKNFGFLFSTMNSYINHKSLETCQIWRLISRHHGNFLKFCKKHMTSSVGKMWSVLTDFGLFNRLFQKSALKWSSFCLKSLVFGLKVCSLRAVLAIFFCKILRRPLHGFSSVHRIKLNQWEWFNSIIISMWNHLCGEIHAQILFKIAKS